MNTSLDERQHLPDTNRMSILAAAILLAYALLPFVQIPARGITLQALGINFVFQVNFVTVTGLICAGLAATGTDWLLRGHPHLGKQSTVQHWLLPALTAWVIGVPLSSQPVSWQWWTVMGFGALLLMLVLAAEYIAVDVNDVRYSLASVGLTAVAFALFLVLLIALAASGSRLYVLLPGVALAIFLVSLRTLYLRLAGQWQVTWALTITLVISQFSAALHYWPLLPLQYGLLILGAAYALTHVAGAVVEGRSWRTLWVEPTLMLVILWSIALGMR